MRLLGDHPPLPLTNKDHWNQRIHHPPGHRQEQAQHQLFPTSNRLIQVAITQTSESVVATTVAARGTKYIKANSPKLPPAKVVPRISPHLAVCSCVCTCFCLIAFSTLSGALHGSAAQHCFAAAAAWRDVSHALGSVALHDSLRIAFGVGLLRASCPQTVPFGKSER